MKMRKVAATLAAVALVGAGLMFSTPAVAAEGVSAQGQPDMICTESGDGWQSKVDTAGDPATVEVTAPEGFLIDAYCVKAGTTKHIVSVDPPSATVVIDHPEKNSVSHYQVHLVPIPVVVEYDAVFDVGIKPATCESGEVLEYGEGNLSFATIDAGSTPSGTEGPAEFSVSATPIEGHAFKEGVVNPITGTLSGPLPADSDECYEEEPVEVTPSISWTAPTCDTAGVLTIGEGPFSIASVLNEDNSQTITFTPNEGYVFPENFDTTWVVPNLDRLSEDSEECDEQGPSCVTVTDSVVIEGDGVLTVDGEWDTTSINVPLNGVSTLADIGTVLDIQADPIQYVGLHIDTPQGTISFEEEPSYGGNLWSESAWDGVSAGMGYAAFGSIEEYIAQNGDVEVTGIRLLYTHPEASSTTVTSFIIGCTEYTFEPRQVPEEPEPIVTVDEEEVVDCEADTITTTTTTTTVGWAFNQETWEWEQTEPVVTVASSVREATDEECPLPDPPLPAPAAPSFSDPCGVDNDEYTLPEDTADYTYHVEWDTETWTLYIWVETVDESAQFEEGAVTEWSHVYTDEDCPVNTPPTSNPPTKGGLAATGGSEMNPLLPLGGGIAIMLGLALGAVNMLRRRMA